MTTDAPPRAPSRSGRRLIVESGCATRCPSCVACPPERRHATWEEAEACLDQPETVLGGGDATRWPYLAAYLREATDPDRAQRVWIEAPARSFTPQVLESLAAGGAHGVVVQIEAAGEQMTKAIGVGDGEAVIALAESLGLQASARLCVRPKTYRALASLAERIAPRRTTLEVLRRDWGGPEIAIPTAPIEHLLLAVPSTAFSGERMGTSGYLPPCALPEAWSVRPDAWSAVLWPRDAPNRSLPACESCALATQCQFTDVRALGEPQRVTPLASAPAARVEQQSRTRAVPDVIVKKRHGAGVVCTTPWTTLDVVDPDGRALQCCGSWTVGDRGSVLDATLDEVWNGEGYRSARRIMASSAVDSLCNAICPRLHDRRFAETRFRIVAGSEPFVKNQLLIAEDIAERREVTRARPTRVSVCPSTYCNYDCIMCWHGRTPRRELPEHVWEQIPELMPTLERLTLLGGEPLASPHVHRFLRDFDSARWPDAVVDFVTNGSLLNEAMLKGMTKCSLGGVTVSLNAGTAEAYERVQRGIALDAVLANLDALIRHRDAQPRWFSITLSFVVQPAASATLVDFARIASSRRLNIRLIPLNPEDHEGLDFYTDPDQVARVLADVDALVAYTRAHEPQWLREVMGSREALVAEAAARGGGNGRTRLPLVS